MIDSENTATLRPPVELEGIPIYKKVSQFTALLKTPDGKVMEPGNATLFISQRAAEFRAAFVPMLKLGTIATIVRIEKGQEIHSFTGRVYLSSQRLLRLVEITDRLLPGCADYLSAETSIPIRLRRSADTKTPPLDATLFYLSTSSFKFTSEHRFHVGDLLYLEMPSSQPMLDGICLEVQQNILFGQRLTGCRCKVLSIPAAARVSLEEYLIEKNRLFDAHEGTTG